MTRARITDDNIDAAFIAADRMLRENNPSITTVVLHVGNSTHKVSNKLIVSVRHRASASTYTTQVWADGMAGCTKREAYNALRTMTATLALLDAR